MIWLNQYGDSFRRGSKILLSKVSRSGVWVKIAKRVQWNTEPGMSNSTNGNMYYGWLLYKILQAIWFGTYISYVNSSSPSDAYVQQ